MRKRAALSYSHRFRQRWQDVAISVFDGGRGLQFILDMMGHIARPIVVIPYWVGGTPEEIRWLISKYNLKRIEKIYTCLVINVQA